MGLQVVRRRLTDRDAGSDTEAKLRTALAHVSHARDLLREAVWVKRELKARKGD